MFLIWAFWSLFWRFGVFSVFRRDRILQVLPTILLILVVTPRTRSGTVRITPWSALASVWITTFAFAFRWVVSFWLLWFPVFARSTFLPSFLLFTLFRLFSFIVRSYCYMTIKVVCFRVSVYMYCLVVFMPLLLLLFRVFCGFDGFYCLVCLLFFEYEISCNFQKYFDRYLWDLTRARSCSLFCYAECRPIPF